MTLPRTAVLGGKRMSHTETGVLLHSLESFDGSAWEDDGDEAEAERAGLQQELIAAFAGLDPPGQQR